MRKIINLRLMSAVMIGVFASFSAVANDSKNDLSSEDFEKVSKGKSNAWGEISHPSDENPAHKANMILQDQAAADQESYNTSWRKWFKDNTITGAKVVGGKLWENASYYARLGIAWNFNFYVIETLEEVTANIAYAGATFMAGPAAGTGAYYTAKGVLKTLRFVVPGFEGYFSGAYAPITKALVVDPIIDYGPTVIKGTVKAGIATVKAGIKGIGSLYNWAMGS